jgi:signal transduction histidine kinase
VTSAPFAESVRRSPAWLVDVAITVSAALAICVTISASQEGGSTAPDLVAYLLGVAIAAPLLVRRRWPRAVLVASAALLLGYYMLDYPAIGVAVPLAGPTYFAVAAGHRNTAIATTGALELAALLYRALAEGESLVSVIGLGTVADLSLLAAVVLLAETVESRRALRVETRERVRALEREREQLAERRVEQERLRIARELHDVLGHTITVINIHAGVVAESLEDDRAQARASLAAIRDESRAATGQLKATLGVLREGDSRAPLVAVPQLADVDRLVASLGVEGLDVEVQRVGERRSLPSEVELTAYRVVQESLTNVVRHAHAGSVSVRLVYEPEALVVTVSDDGRGPGARLDSRAGDHRGIAGMRERVEALGGSLHTGAGPGAGFRVSARMPTGIAR